MSIIDTEAITDLGLVPVALAPEEQEDLTTEEVVPAKKKRRTGSELIEHNLSVAREKLAKLEGKLATARSATGYESTRAARDAAVKVADERVKAQSAQVMKLRKDFDEAQIMEQIAREQALAKAAKAALDAEDKAARSEACLVTIVECKLAQDKRFDGKKEKNDKIWPEAHANYLRAIADDDLPESDNMSLEAMQAKYAQELQHFRRYAKDVQRYKQSGAPADDVEKIPKRCVTGPEPRQLALSFFALCAPNLQLPHAYHTVPFL
jgi:hypothetical protein